MLIIHQLEKYSRRAVRYVLLFKLALLTVFVVCSLPCVLFFAEDISPNGTASQSSNYRTRYAYLAITGGPSHDFNAGSCSATNSNQNISWWMLTFPSDKVFVSNVIIYYRSNCKYFP